MFLIKLPKAPVKEMSYSLNTLLGEFLGLEFKIEQGKKEQFIIEHEGSTLSINAQFFLALAKGKEKELINQPCKTWDSKQVTWDIALIDTDVPVLFGEPIIKQSKQNIDIGFDIFGAAFFMLSRYEEILPSELDSHSRFMANQSMAYKNDFLLRPIIDEYVEILWTALRKLWPNIKRKNRQYEIVPTHDVDTPYLATNLKASQLIRRAAGDIIHRKNSLLAVKTVASFIQYRLSRNIPSYDPYNVYDWFMKQSERAGVSSRFYFMINLEPDNFYGGRYDIDEAHIVALMKEISSRGHEIGIHPTSESYSEKDVIKIQANILRTALEDNNISQKQLGGRQHYLRWQADKTPSLWNDGNLDYDSTLSYAEHAGFRCGTCHSFPLWDFNEQKTLKTYEHPLIVMECSLLEKNYMNLSHDEALKTIKQLQQAVKIVKGRFVFLWHNSALLCASNKTLYKACCST